MLHIQDATIDCDDDTAGIYETALQEHLQRHADANGYDYEPSEDDLILFPLSGVQVAHMGSRLSLSLRVAGQPNFILDRLIRCPEPTESSKGDDGPQQWSFTGSSERLHMDGVEDADGKVTFTVEAPARTVIGTRES
jgi:hypothetical protein